MGQDFALQRGVSLKVMKASRSLTVRVVCCATLATIALVASVDAASRSRVDVSGKIEGGAYVNPERTFRIELPRLRQPAAVIQDRIFHANGWLVEFADDLCRNYALSERQIDLADEDFPSWVLRVAIPQIEQGGGMLMSAKRITQGPHAIMLLRYRQPKRAPCTIYRAPHATLVEPGGYDKADEKKLLDQGFTVTHPDAQVGMYIFYAAGRVYRLSYTVGDKLPKQSSSIRVVPVEVNLEHFLKGFELLR
jgi:hypothetical protein